MNYGEFLNLIDPFLEHVSKERNLSPHTRKSYYHDLQQLVRFWHALQEREQRIFELKDVVGKHFSVLQHQSIHKNSIARKVSCLNSYARFVNHTGHHAVALELTRPYVPPRRLSLIAESDMIFLEQKILSDEDLLLRDRAIFKLFLDTGIRCSELVELPIAYIDLINKTAIVRSTRRKERIVSFTEHCAALISRYQKEGRRPAQSVQEKLFCNYRGEPLTPRSVQRIFTIMQGRYAIAGEFTPHVMRNSYAVKLLNNGEAPDRVQEMLGHAVYASVEKYFSQAAVTAKAP